MRDDELQREAKKVFMTLRNEPFDLLIIGGGIAGNAFAAVMARAGRAVLVLERSTAYRDRVRGEGIHAWGVAEAQRLGLHEALVAAGGTHHRRFVPYDETVTPAEAMVVLPRFDGHLG